MGSAAPATERGRQPKHDELVSGTAWYGTTRQRHPAGTMAPEPVRRARREGQAQRE
jgi:hypothetical protein